MGTDRVKCFNVLLVSHLHFSYSFIASEAGAEPSKNLQVVKLMLISTPVSRKLGGRIVLLSLLEWFQRIIHKAVSLDGCISTAYMNFLGGFGRWRGLLSSLRQQNLKQGC